MDPAPHAPATRRQILTGLGGLALAGLAGALVAGCSTTESTATGPDGGLPPGDVAAARTAAARSGALAAAYRAAAAQHPSLRTLLDSLRAHHEVAVSTIVAQVPVAAPAPAGTASSTPSGSGTTQGTGVTPGVTAVTPSIGMTSTDVDDAPAAQRATLTDLHGAERGAAAAAHADSLRVTGALAPLLASLYAASDARVELLGAYLAQAGDPAGAAR